MSSNPSLPTTVPTALDGHGANLFSLCLGVGVEPGLLGRQQYLERVNPVNAGGDRHDGDHPTTETGRGRVGSVIADDHSRSGTSRLAADNRIQVHKPDLTPSHQLSATAVSQPSLAGSSDHSVNAAA